MKISTKLTLLFSIIIIIVGLLPSYLFYSSGIKQLERALAEKLAGESSDALKTVDRIFYERYLDIGILAADPILSAKNSTPKQITARLMEYKTSHPAYRSFSFFNLNRVRIADTAGLEIGVRHALTEYWPEALAGKNFVTSLSNSESLGEAVLHFAAIVKDRDGTPVGLVVSRVPLESFDSILKEHIGKNNLGNEALIELLDKDGLIVYSSRNKADMFNKTSHEWGRIKEFLDKGENTASLDNRREENLIVFARETGHLDFKGSGWILLLKVPKKVAFAAVGELGNRSQFILLLLATLVFPVVFLFSRNIVKPIRKLSAASAEIGRGNLGVRIDINANDEFGELAASFNHMAGDLQQANAARDKTEGKLLKSRATLRAIMDNSPYMIWLKDTDGRYLAANLEFLKSTGRAEMGEVVGSTDFDLWPPERAKKIRAVDAEVMATHRQKLTEEAVADARGELSWIEILTTAVVDKNGQLLGTSGFARDTTERRRMEDKLKHDAEQVEALLSINSVGGLLTEKDLLRFGLEWVEKLTASKIAFLHFVNADQENIELVAWSSATMEIYCDADYDSHYPLAQAGVWADSLRQKQAVVLNDYAGQEDKHGLPEGHAALQRMISVPIIEDGLVCMILGVGNKETDYSENDVQIAQLIGHDLWRIAQRQRSEAELKQNFEQQRLLNKKLEDAHSHLLQSEKMASLGQLAAGVAHELNNPIGFVYSNMGALESYLNDIFAINAAYEEAEKSCATERCTVFEPVHKLKLDKDYDYIKQDIFQLMAQSKDGLGRMRNIVQNLKDFSHVGEEGWKWTDLHKGIDSTLNIVWNELKYKCRVNKEYGVLPEVYCIASQINQVLLNLLVNAGQAIETKGVITVRTGVEGDEVWVEVEDSGKGIPPGEISRIFDPFFTTKPVGVGTGLGLSLSYSIMQKHHGRIEVKSEVGKGTTMRIYLPVQPAQMPEAAAS